MTVQKEWITKDRFYELKRFCRRYDEWRRAINELNMDYSPSYDRISGAGVYNADPTGNFAIIFSYFMEKISLVENCAKMADRELAPYLLLAVTKGLKYKDLERSLNAIECSEQKYRKAYRMFFILLNRALK